jgi:hypothetical protein
MRVYQVRHPGWVQGREVSGPARQPSTVAGCKPGAAYSGDKGWGSRIAMPGRSTGRMGA